MRLFRSPDTRSIAFLVALPFIYFWQITLGQQVLYATDTIRLFHPFGVELARALNEGRLPLWTPYLQSGFPLFAEGQVAALYPLNLVLYKFLPAHFALSYALLIHLAFAGAGMYLCARAFGYSPVATLLAGIAFSLGGFSISQLNHPTITAASAWLPWIILFQRKFFAAAERRARWFLLSAISIGVMYLAGSVQIAFLNSVAFLVVGLFNTLLDNRASNVIPSISRPAWRVFGQKRGKGSSPAALGGTAGSAAALPPKGRFLSNAFDSIEGDSARGLGGRGKIETFMRTSIFPLALGIGIAAVQLIPTAELIGYSVRSTGLGEDAVTYSLPPHFLVQFLAPFTLDYPGEDTNEYWGFIGVAAFLLCASAPFLKRNRRAIFFAAVALITISLALGAYNPLNQFLFRLPGFSFFRVPARFLLLTTFAGAMLAAHALDELARRAAPPRQSRAPILITFVAACGVAALMWLATFQKLQFWLDLWKFLPSFAIFASLVLWMLVRSRKISRATVSAAFIGLTLIELTAFAPAFFTEYLWLSPPAFVQTPVRSFTALNEPLGMRRVWTDQSFFPSIPSLRNSVFPNLALFYGIESAQIYSSLAFGAHEAMNADPTPTILNLMNVQYYLIPLDPRGASQFSAPVAAFALDVQSRAVNFPAMTVRSVELSTYTENAAALRDGTPVAELVLHLRDGSEKIFPLRVGSETADWDFERKSAESAIQYSRAQIVHDFPAFWRSFARPFQGATYRARFDLATPQEIVGIQIRPLMPAARLNVEAITLFDANQTLVSLATLTHRLRFSLAYQSDTVAVWRNEDVLPRAFIAHSAELANDDAVFARLHDDAFQPASMVLLADGEPLTDSGATQGEAIITRYEATRVEIAVRTDRAGYVVLTDSWYPGWRATVDGNAAPIQRADAIFRAVRVEAGQHRIVFEYAPTSLTVGIVVSVLSLILAAFSARFIGRA
ncbi:MAG: YfhO family protein [Chloroflexi bacterium]|nr:YfhO family protein [Chloroflexota bacterium]